jgi:hypothetical protein
MFCCHFIDYLLNSGSQWWSQASSPAMMYGMEGSLAVIMVQEIFFQDSLYTSINIRGTQ